MATAILPKAGHSLCLDNAQVFNFQPQPSGFRVWVQRFAVTPGKGRRLARTAFWALTVEEAREMWSDLKLDGAFEVDAYGRKHLTPRGVHCRFA